MVCSTSAKSSVRLINTTSFRDCLQFRCMKIITKYPQLLDVSTIKCRNFPLKKPKQKENEVIIHFFISMNKQKVQNIPGLASLCRDVWFMFPKERYQYSEKSGDNQHENNVGAQMSTDVKVDGGVAIDDCGQQSMDLNDDCDSLPGNSLDSSTEHEDIDDAIFLSTFKDEPQQSSSDDSDPVYDDGD